MPNFSQLAPRVARVRNNVRRETERVVREVATEMINTLVNGTPVDTSQALSNWRASVGTKILTTRPAISKGFRGSTRSSSAMIAISEGEQVVQFFRVGQSIHLTNNLPYIEGLNDGTISKQPSGFVQAALLVARNHLSKVRVSL